MRLEVLVADDEPVSQRVVGAMLERAGYGVSLATDGVEALARLAAPAAPPIALIDWMMPGLDGPDVIRRLRDAASATATPPYIIVLTARRDTADIVAGLRAGANDYVTKPAHEDELVARVGVGARVVELQRALAERVRSLEEALGKVKQLQGLLPICSYCKAIRNDQNYWQRVENYLHEHSGVTFSHSYCPACYERHVRPQLDALDAPAPATVLDRDVLDMLRNLTQPGRPDVLREVLELFRDDLPRRLDALGAAVASGDMERIGRAAHAIKGSAGNVGARELKDACAAIEALAKQARLADIPAADARLREHAARVVAEIGALLSRE